MKSLMRAKNGTYRMARWKGGSSMKNKNGEGYPDPTATRAIRNADMPPENVKNARRAIKVICEICHVRILGKVTIIDERGRRW